MQRLFGCDPRGLFELNHQSFINNSSYDSVIWLFVLLFGTALQVVKGMDPFTIAATSPSHFSAFRRLSFICLFPINNILLLSLECNYFNWVVKTKEQKHYREKCLWKACQSVSDPPRLLHLSQMALLIPSLTST